MCVTTITARRWLQRLRRRPCESLGPRWFPWESRRPARSYAKRIAYSLSRASRWTMGVPRSRGSTISSSESQSLKPPSCCYCCYRCYLQFYETIAAVLLNKPPAPHAFPAPSEIASYSQSIVKDLLALSFDDVRVVSSQCDHRRSRVSDEPARSTSVFSW